MPWRVTIIGGGPAGSMAALLLARGGCAVTLVEQHRFPRDKVCGECLSATGIDVLGRAGLAPQLLTHSPVTFTHAAIHPPDDRSVRLPLPRPMWGISRARFDGFLLDTARQAGATLLQPARCERIDPGSSPKVRLRMLESNELVAIESDWVLLADGKPGLSGATPPRTNDFGVKAHFENVEGPPNEIELFGCSGLYGGLAPIEGGRWNAAFSVPGRRLRMHRGDVAELFARIVQENPALRRRLGSARRIGRWRVSPLPRFPVQAHWPAGVIPIGNSAAAIEPIGGEGMGLALRSAELAARAILASNGPLDLHRLAREFRHLWRTRRPACRLAASVISRTRVAEPLVPLLEHFPRLSACALALLGK